MWIIRLFMQGKMFPSGNLSSFKWQMYVFDIVRFITTPQFLKWFLRFDPKCFFKLITPLFTENEPFNYILTQKSFVEMYKQRVPGLETCSTHSEILQTISENVQEMLDQDRAECDG